MNHDDIRHKLSEYIDDAVSPNERAAIEAHLASCTECADALSELRKTIEHVRSIEEVESPAWMTGKIMATVREEAERKKSFVHRLFFPLTIKVPLQAVALLFVAVTAYYIYEGAHPEEKYSEAPRDLPAKKEAPAPAVETLKQKASKPAAPREKKVEQKPGYRSLDMKDEYEKPAVPAPAPQESAVPQKSKSAAPLAFMGKAAAPPVMAEQASGAARALEERRTATGAKAFSKDDLDELNLAEDEAKDQSSITAYFVSNDLQETMQVRGLQFITRKVPGDLSGLEWLRDMSAYRSKPCARRYVVDVELPGRSLKYLYCYDRTRIRRLGVFELISGVWMEI